MRTLFVIAFVAVAVAIGLTACANSPREDGPTTVSLIHMGDVHGHMVERPNTRSDRSDRNDRGGSLTVGGLARMYTRIDEIRAASPHSLLINTGDTIQGSAEALFTRGQALVDVLNLFKIDAFVPGNWEFVYGTERFREVFAASQPLAPWGAIAANVFYDGAPYADGQGQRVLPPYVIKNVGGIKVGILAACRT